MRSLHLRRYLLKYLFSGLLGLATLLALPIANAACSATWSATAVYTGGMTASLSGIEYRANWWTQGENPSTHNGGPGSGQPWTSLGSCTAQPPPPPPPPPPPGSLLFSPYKDITISMNWNTNVISTQVTGTNLRFSFTIATLGGNAPQSLGQTGVNVVNAIKAAGLQGYLINLMVMDYGSTIPSNCTIVNGRCDMGKSAIAAAESLHNFHGIPYSQIELTPMIGGNDTQDETFDLGDITELSNYARQKGLRGVHHWSWDRDRDCPPGFASPTCNSYGQAGTLGFTTRFPSALGL